jgi:hypothetical protein
MIFILVWPRPVFSYHRRSLFLPWPILAPPCFPFFFSDHGVSLLHFSGDHFLDHDVFFLTPILAFPASRFAEAVAR